MDKISDNVDITAGSGTSIATDQVGDDHYQQVKLVDGTADSSTAIASGGGVEAAALRVTIASDSTGVISIDDNGSSVTVDGTVTANLGTTDNAVLDAIQAAVEILDNCISGSEAQVDVLTVPAPLNVTGTGTEAAALRVTIASDSTGVISIDDNGGAITVDGTVTANLSSTDNAVLDAIQAAVEVIDNAISGSEMQVDVLTVPAPLSSTGGGTEAAALRVTVANDSTGVISVDDGGGALTVDGTVTANLSSTDNAVLDDIAAKLATIDADTSAIYGCVGGTELQVDIVSGAGSGGTASDDDADFTAESTAGTPAMGVYESSPTSVTDGDLGIVGISADRRLKVLADLGATDNAVLDDVAAKLGTIDADTSGLFGCVGGTELQVDVVSGTVTANLGATDNTVLDNIDADTSAIQTAVELIDDAVYADDADWTDSTSKHVLVGGLYQSTQQTITDGDVGPVQVDANGNMLVSVADDSSLVQDGDAIASTYGILAAGTDGSNAQFMSVDASGNVQCDIVSGTVDLGTTDNAVLDDIAAKLATIDSDTSAIYGCVAGSEMQVDIVSGAGSGGTAQDDDADFTAGDTAGTPAMGVYESSPSSVTDGDLGVVGITQTRQLRVSADLGATDNAVLDAIQAAVETIDDCISGSEAQVDVVAALPAGDNNIGNVDIVTVPAPLDATGGGTEAAALRVTIANDSTGVVSVDDGGGALTVDGTVTANLSATDNTVLDNIDTNTTGLAGTVSGSELQVDVVAALPAGSNAIGKLAANSGVDVGDVDVLTCGAITPGTAAANLGKAEDAAHSSGDSGVYALAVRDDTLAAHSGTDGDYESLHTNLNGALYVETSPGAKWTGYHDIASGDAVHDGQELEGAPGASLSLYLTDLIITNDDTADMTFTIWEDEGGGSEAQLMGTQYVPASGGISAHFTTPIKLTANLSIGFDNSGQSNASITVMGYTAA